jgi:hypothetical protein
MDSTLGALATSSDGSDFVPGGTYSVTLMFWADTEVREHIRDGLPFTVWYGGDIGSGHITTVL